MTTTPIFPPTRDGLPLGLGGAPLGNMFAPVPEAQVSVLFETALADGCRSFDTAPHYGHGLSELRFGQMLRGQPPGGFALSSKVGRLLTPDAKAMRDQNGFVDGLPFNQHWDFSAQGVRRGVEDSLQRLGLAGLDTVFVHDWTLPTMASATRKCSNRCFTRRCQNCTPCAGRGCCATSAWG